MFVFFIRMIDSAQAYDEEQVGEAVQESGIPREEVFIVSKVHPRFLGYDETLKSVEESLTKLKVIKCQLSALLLFSLKFSWVEQKKILSKPCEINQKKNSGEYSSVSIFSILFSKLFLWYWKGEFV